MERFDYASSSAPKTVTQTPYPTPQPNGHPAQVKTESKPQVKSRLPPKHTPETADEDEESDVVTPPKKKRKEVDNDAKLAAMLQAQENSRARPTRGSSDKKRPVVKKRTPKKKSADKVKREDDSDLELDSQGEVKEKVKKGGFHKQYYLSAPLADLVGEPTVSRHFSPLSLSLSFSISPSIVTAFKRVGE